MIGIAAAAVLGLAIVALIWVRLAARQSERRSVRDYERALGALGGASRRTDRLTALGHAAPIEAGRPHVRAASGELPPPRQPGEGPPPRARIELASRPPARRRPDQGRPPLREPAEPAALRQPAERGAGDAAPSDDRTVPMRPVPAVTGPGRPLRPSVERSSLERPPPERPSPQRPSPERSSPERPSPERPSPERYSPLRRVFGPALPNGGGVHPYPAPSAPSARNGGDLAAQAPGTLAPAAGERSEDPATEAVESVERTLPLAALDQLVVRSRRLRSGGRAALSTGAALRTSIPGTETGVPATPTEHRDPEGEQPAPRPDVDEKLEVRELEVSHPDDGQPDDEQLADERAADGQLAAEQREYEQLEDEAVPIVFDFDELAEPPYPPTRVRPIRGLQRPGARHTMRRLAAGAAALVVVAAAGVGIWQLATRTSPVSTRTVQVTPPSHHPAPPDTTTRTKVTKPTTPTTPTRVTTAPPTTQPSATLSPISTTPTLIVYRAPASAYTLRFTVSAGECWVGAHTGSVWTWQATISPAAPASYAATGTSTIRIGAPSVLSVTADGKPVILPKSVHPYDLEFSTAAK